jgi:AcrR family transcriptional regulator
MVTGDRMAAQRKAQADDTRKRIFQAAAELFSVRGYAHVTVAEIAKRAGVAKGTFFVHFATKDAVLTELVRIQTSQAKKARLRAQSAGGTPRDHLRTTVLMLGEQAGASRGLSRAVLAGTLESSDVGGAAGLLFDEVFQAMCVDSCAHYGDERAARACMASYLGVALHFCSTPSSPPLLEILEPLVDSNLDGFDREKEGTNETPRGKPRLRRRSERLFGQ